MDGPRPSISLNDLYAHLSASHRAPDELERWRQDLPSGRAVIAYCVRWGYIKQFSAPSKKK